VKRPPAVNQLPREWFGKRVDWIVCVVGEGLNPGSTDAHVGEGGFL